MASHGIVALAESDSFVRWADDLVDRLGGTGPARRAIVRYPTNPSDRQVRDQIGAERAARWERRSLRRALRIIAEARPRIVLLAVTGPLVDLTVPLIREESPDSLIVNGVPGVALPIHDRAVRRRTGVDVFVAHSLEERSRFRAAFAAVGAPVEVALATLPGLVPLRPTPPRTVRSVCFLDQAIVPRTPADRRRLLHLLDGLPVDRVVVKLRSRSDETSSDRSSAPLDRLDAPSRIEFRTGDLAKVVGEVEGALTVGSTAVLEAASLGLAVGTVADFGHDDELRNEVFRGSGSEVTLSDPSRTSPGLELGGFSPGWARENYFHGRMSDDLDTVVASATPAPPAAPGARSGRTRTRVKSSRMYPAIARVVGGTS